MFGRVSFSKCIVSILILTLVSKYTAHSHPQVVDHQQHDHQRQGHLQLTHTSSAEPPNEEPFKLQLAPEFKINSQERPKSQRKIVDLSYSLDNNTIHWPTNAGFAYTVQRDGKDKTGVYIKADSISTAIHTGTHLDSPIHFAPQAKTVEKIPLQRLIDIPLVVVDVSKKVALNRTYNFEKADFLDHAGSSLVHEGSIVLVYTGISDSYAKGEKAYYGCEDPKNSHEIKIPGFGKEAAEFLVSEKVFGVGLDSPSADSSDKHGPDGSFNPVAHRAFLENDIFILENVNGNLKQLIDVQAAKLIIAPLPIVSGSGSPVRLIAIVGGDEFQNNAAHLDRFNIFAFYFGAIMAALVYLAL